MSSHGSEEAELCQHQRISVNMLSHVWHASSVVEVLVEQTKSLCWKNRESARNDEFVYEYVFEASRENYE